MKHLAVLALALMGCSNAIDPETWRADVARYQGPSVIVTDDNAYQVPESIWSLHSAPEQGPFILESGGCIFAIDTPGEWGPLVCEIVPSLTFEVGPGRYWTEGETFNVLAWLRDPGVPGAWGSVTFRGRRVP